MIARIEQIKKKDIFIDTLRISHIKLWHYLKKSNVDIGGHFKFLACYAGKFNGFPIFCDRSFVSTDVFKVNPPAPLAVHVGSP